MLRKDKEAVVDELREKLTSARSVFLTDFSGINVKSVNELRRKFRGASVEYLVAKNTLIKRAVAGTALDQLDPFLNGPTAMVVSRDEGVQAAKVIDQFVRDHQSFHVKVGVLAEKLVDAGQVKVIANLPSREVLLAKVLGTMNAPIANFVFVLNETVARSVRTLDAVAKTKQA